MVLMMKINNRFSHGDMVVFKTYPTSKVLPPNTEITGKIVGMSPDKRVKSEMYYRIEVQMTNKNGKEVKKYVYKLDKNIEKKI